MHLKYEDIESLHIEFTTRCQARCPMCIRTMYNDKIPHGDINFYTFKTWVHDELIARLKSIIVCGNYGDGVVSKDIIDIFEYVRVLNPECMILFLTNGAARDVEFWQRMAKANVIVKFALDGLEDTHKLYRLGTDWQTIINNAKTFIAAGGRARWQMITFKHNEHQIDACKKMSEELGFEEFIARDTPRFKDMKEFPVSDVYGDYCLEPTRRSEILSKTRSSLTTNKDLPVLCESLVEKRIYIGADGVVSPCSWLECVKVLTDELIAQYNELFEGVPTLHTHTLKEIVESDKFKSLYDMTRNHPMAVCRHHCVTKDAKRAEMLAARRNIS